MEKRPTIAGVVTQAEADGRVLVITFLDAQLNFYTADAVAEIVQRQIDSALEGGCRHIVLDLTHVRVMDSSGVRLLSMVRNRCERAAARAHLCRPASVVSKVLEIVGLAGAFPVFATLEEALQSIPGVGARP